MNEFDELHLINEISTKRVFSRGHVSDDSFAPFVHAWSVFVFCSIVTERYNTLMEIFSTALLFIAAVAIIAYTLITETTDWIGRAEIIESRWPRLWGVMNNRPMRLVLIVVALVMMADVIQQFRTGAEPVQSRFPSPGVPALEPIGAPPPESPDSLRRRTVRLADDLYVYIERRQRDHPPRAYPNSGDPNPSEERKKLIQTCVNYDQRYLGLLLKTF
jgi:hypothetical protein